MNVVIVDDQRLSRAGLIKMIDWEGLGLKLAAECANGREALERIGDTDADLVITDVRMPVMDGLELIEKSKEQYPGIAYIVISGYDDYPYIRKSVQLTVADYLLKPVDAAELNALLGSLVRRLAEQARQAEANLRSWRERFFHFLFEGVYEDDETALLAEFADIGFGESDGRFVAAAFESELDKQAVYEALATLRDRVAVCVLRMRGVYVLVAEAPELTAERVAELLGGLEPELRRIGIGTTACGIAGLRESAGRALDAHAIRASRPDLDGEPPALYERLAAEAAGLFPLSAAWEQDWAFHLRQGNRDAALGKLAELMRASSAAHPDIASSSCQYVLLRGARELFEAGFIREPDFLEARRIARTLSGLAPLDDKKRQVGDFFRSRLKAPEGEQSLETRQAVEKAKTYIDAHYCETINLSELAQKSYMSPGYFSALFRQHTGRNFLEYVTGLRMERAKALLAADPDRKIGDVALQCGYQDLKYFRKLFKRHTGITPLGFKEEAGR